jgi:hypothetical protein
MGEILSTCLLYWKDDFQRSRSRSWPNGPLFTSGRMNFMFFTLPAQEKKKIGAGRMFLTLSLSQLLQLPTYDVIIEPF